MEGFMVCAKGEDPFDAMGPPIPCWFATTSQEAMDAWEISFDNGEHEEPVPKEWDVYKMVKVEDNGEF